MAATTINVTTAAGSRVLFVNEIKRFVTKGTGTQITIGTAEGRGTFTEDIDVTQSLATVVNLIGNAFLPLTVYTTTSTGVVTYYPVLAIRGVEAATNAIAAVKSRVLVASANGRGTFVDGVLVGETVTQVNTLLNAAGDSGVTSVRVGSGAAQTGAVTIPVGAGGVSSLSLGGGAAQTGAVSIPVNSTSGTTPTLLSANNYLEILQYSNSLRSFSYIRNYDVTSLISSFGVAGTYSFLIAQGTVVSTKTLDIDQLLLYGNSGASQGNSEIILTFSSALTSLTLNFPEPMLIIELNGTLNTNTRSSITISSVRSVTIKFSVSGAGFIAFVTKTS
jgi:hypothetical protein